jgi:hypothetical protein
MKIKVLNKTSNSIDVFTTTSGGVKYVNRLQPKSINPEYWFLIITEDDCMITLKDAIEEDES